MILLKIRQTKGIKREKSNLLMNTFTKSELIGQTFLQNKVY